MVNPTMLRSVLLVTVVLLIAGNLNPAPVAAQSPDAISDCPVTSPAQSMVPGAPPFEGPTRAWYGSPRLAALLPANGNWVGMGPERTYGDKFWWWRSGYNAHEEPMPNLVVSATLLDRTGPNVEVRNATYAFGDGWQSLLVGMEFPSASC